MSEEENESGFTIKDRRRFDEKGETRDSGTESSESSSETSSESSSDTSADSLAQPNEPSPDSAAARNPVAPDFGSDDASGIPLEEAGGLTFSGFIIGLAQQAFMFLGVIPDPHSAIAHKDLLQARAMIDIIEMLRDKTRGNLEELEERMMEEMLEELHLQYVREVHGSMNPQGDSQ